MKCTVSKLRELHKQAKMADMSCMFVNFFWNMKADAIESETAHHFIFMVS